MPRKEFEQSTNIYGEDTIICPYCKSSNDPTDMRSDEEEWHCNNCGELFLVEAEYEVTYATYRRKNPVSEL